MPPNSRISVRSFADQAFDTIVEAIVRGDMLPGSRIGEVEAANQLGISRGPLREALARLEVCNLVLRKPNRGVFVAEVSAKDYQDLFDIREPLEGLACRLAAERITEEELKRLRSLLEKHGESEGVRTGTQYYQGAPGDDFHVQIVLASRNRRLTKVLGNDLYHQLRFYRYRSSVRTGRTPAAFEEHWAILDALEARDSVRAEQAMRRHIRNGRPVPVGEVQ